MMKLVNSIFLFFIFISADAQRCALGVMAKPELQKRHENFQKILEQYNGNNRSNLRIQEGIIKIPVVVHVIHNKLDKIIGGTGNTNISDHQIFSQIKVLNEDFRRQIGTLGYNELKVGTDMEIEFFLAQVDPNGTPSSGITRNYINKSNFNIFNDLNLVSNLSYWDSNKYLNIWVMDFSGLYLGYGEFPGAAVDGLELADAPERTDGVFVDHEAFGRQIGTATGSIYGYGRTLTHEIGHWLGLLHTWGDARCGDDYCYDTPVAERENDSETCRTVFSRCSGVATRNMIENYMDYTPDSCMNVFTIDQKKRVRDVLELSPRRRRMVLNSEFLLPSNEFVDLKIIGNPSAKNQMAFQVLLPEFQDFTLRFYDVLGREVASKSFKDYPSTVIRAENLNIPSGLLIMQLITKDIRITKRIIVL
jgi:hypothetical protein